MFHINNNPILADDMAVLEELRKQLAEIGIKRFAKFKRTNRNIQFPCPHHSNGQERNPSCGISTEPKGDMPSGIVHCFTCGYKATLEEMVSHCFGFNDFGEFGRRWLIKNFLTVSIENRKAIKLDFDRRLKIDAVEYVTESELDAYRYYHPYMYERGLTDEIIGQFDVGYDPSFKLANKFGTVKGILKCLTFPVRDITGKTLFIARRAVDRKFFYYPAGVNKPVYGLYEVPKDADEIVVCESIFDALTCWVYGKYAVALMGLGTQYQYDQLRHFPCRKYITAFDGDEAGYMATGRIVSALQGHKILTIYDIPDNRDINDLTYEEFIDLAEIFP